MPLIPCFSQEGLLANILYGVKARNEEAFYLLCRVRLGPRCVGASGGGAH